MHDAISFESIVLFIMLMNDFDTSGLSVREFERWDLLVIVDSVNNEADIQLQTKADCQIKLL